MRGCSATANGAGYGPSVNNRVALDCVGVVVIGRNEGERLHVCLTSIRQQTDRIIYVDSGSSDDSVAYARAQDIDTVELDAGAAFTAARARNAGVARLARLWPDLAFVQFIDGDCELEQAWLAEALSVMVARPSIGAVCGSRHERYPDHSVYNRLCEMEWDAPAGLTESCGGDAMMRLSAFVAAGGFADEMIAGEEADLCHRMRQRDWQIVRLPIAMTRHDANMTRLSQWWQRNRRSGHAGAEAWHRRGAEDRRLIKPVVSNLLWGLPLFWPLWPLLWWRVYRRSGALYATHIVIGKLPHCAGQLGFWWSGVFARRVELIEYK
jgi:GT2 family glycosyltransferase